VYRRDDVDIRQLENDTYAISWTKDGERLVYQVEVLQVAPNKYKVNKVLNLKVLQIYSLSRSFWVLPAVPQLLWGMNPARLCQKASGVSGVLGCRFCLAPLCRLLVLACMSFWGPTAPATRLRPIASLRETVRYGKVPCSPCIHVAEEPPCQGNNVCIQSLFYGDKDYDSVFWLA
jgi:hypothetical protein